MDITKQFLNKIKVLLIKGVSDDNFDDFNDLEDWFLDNAYALTNENKEISRLGDLIQDQIAEMGYMDDNSIYIKKIRSIYNQMLEIYNKEFLQDTSN